MVCQRLEATPHELPPPAAVALARTASVLAMATGWCSPEAAYWRTLCFAPPADSTIPMAPATLPTGDEAAVCGQLARRLVWLANPWTDGAPAPHAATGLPEAAAWTLLERLELQFPAVDWSAVLAETRAILTDADNEPNDDRHWLIEQARQESLAHEHRCLAAVVALFRAESGRHLARAAHQLCSLIIGEPFGLWLGTESQRLGYGSVDDPLQACPASALSHQTDFEKALLPPTYRWSMEIADPATAVTYGRLYCERPIEPDKLTRWLAHLAAAVSRARESTAQPARAEAATKHPLAAAEQLFSELERRFQTLVGEFSAGAGHEINNPLAAILGQAEWLLAGEMDPDRRRALQKIADQVERIHGMIRDLQVIGRATTSKQADIALAEVLDAALAQVAADSRATQLTLEPVDLTWRVCAHRMELGRCVAELVRNGIEAAGEAGRVVIRARREVPRGHRIIVEIIDSGPGFSDVERRNAFGPFFSGRQAGRGLGMGLPVARRIAADHRGCIWLGRQRPTTVFLALPLIIAPDTPLPGCPAPS